MDGLRFSCVPGCIACCDVPGFVYITENDLRRIAAYLKLKPAEFESRYVYRTRHRLRLRKPPGSQCHFLRKDGCMIHVVKPTQCRLFPFWPELVENRQAWEQAGGRCPGIGTGPLFKVGTALEIAEEMKETYPAPY